MTDVLIGKTGKILEGHHKGWFVRVMDDAENTGGYLVVVSPNHDMSGEGFDGWVENLGELKSYFDEAHWIVDWS